jgi:peptidoglycan/LPS O-acetylase OafA/YrhL
VRAFAVTIVLVAHCFIAAKVAGTTLSPVIRHLQIGVSIFFLISAFLLYRPFVAARSGKVPKVTVYDYARRRVLRVVPGYYVALVLLSVYPGIQAVFGSDWWVYFGFLQVYEPLYSIDPVCYGPPYDCGLGAAWSLAVEVSFYVLLPILVLVLGKLTQHVKHPVRVELGVLVALGIASALVRLYAYEGIGTVWLLGTLTTTFLWFATGMALAVVSVALQGRERLPRLVDVVVRRPWAPWLAALCLFVAEIVVLELTTHSGRETVTGLYVRYFFFTAIALLLVLPATFGDGAGGWPRRILASRGLAWIGVISYGIFLYHLPIAFELASFGLFDISNDALRMTALTLATFFLSVACAAVSYRFVERPFLRLKYRQRRGSPSPSPIPAAAGDR